MVVSVGGGVSRVALGLLAVSEAVLIGEGRAVRSLRGLETPWLCVLGMVLWLVVKVAEKRRRSGRS